MLSSSSSSLQLPKPFGAKHPVFPGTEKVAGRHESVKIECWRRSIPTPLGIYTSFLLEKCIPLAASVAILLWTNSADAGILSGFSGLESMPGPQLPQLDFLTKWNNDNQKRYSEFDSRFKSSPLLKQLLEKSKINKERNWKEIQDKYCIRGAEWGVGDCSTQGMTQEEKDNFIALLKKKSEGE